VSSKLKDIAEYLNISVSTVSRVVTGKDRVRADTREKVLEAVKKFNYHPNDVARSLKKKSTNVLAIVVPDITNSFFAMVFKGFESVVRQHKYTVILCSTDEDHTRENEYLEFLMEKQVAGLVIATVSSNTDYIEKYKASGVPVVYIDNLPNLDDNYDFVMIDNVKASFELTNHMIDNGHEQIAIISGPLDQTSGKGTYQGWLKAMEERQLEVNSNWVRHGTFKYESGYALMKEMLKQKRRPTAIFVANSSMAYGAIKAVHEHGLKIPEDISMVTFDAIDQTNGLISPQLTCIVEPAEDIGVLAAEIILRKITNPKIKSFQKVTLEHQLVIKESCARLRGK